MGAHLMFSEQVIPPHAAGQMTRMDRENLLLLLHGAISVT